MEDASFKQMIMQGEAYDDDESHERNSYGIIDTITQLCVRKQSPAHLPKMFPYLGGRGPKTTFFIMLSLIKRDLLSMM